MTTLVGPNLTARIIAKERILNFSRTLQALYTVCLIRWSKTNVSVDGQSLVIEIEVNFWRTASNTRKPLKPIQEQLSLT